MAREEFQVLLDRAKAGRDGGEALRPSGRRREEGRRVPSLVRQAVHLLLHQPSLAGAAVRREGMIDLIEQLELEGAPLLAELLRAAGSDPALTTAALVERYRGHEAGPHLVRLAGESLLIEDEEAREAEFAGVLIRLRDTARRQRLERLRGRMRSGSISAAEEKEYVRLLAEGGRPRVPAANAEVRGPRR